MSRYLLMLMFCCSFSVYGEQRIALVMGNADYTESRLANPANDAVAISDRLEKLGFDVIRLINSDLKSMQRGLLALLEKIEPRATVLVFYAGHAVQANGKNYLIPVDATMKSEAALRFEAMELSHVLDVLAQSGSLTNLIVLDACRNNPFETSFRGMGASRGLAVVNATAGSLIAYATSPGSIASDGEGQNGLYTRELLKALDTPNLQIEEIFKRVRRGVIKVSGGQQTPWESSSLVSDLVLNPSDDIPLANNDVSLAIAQAVEAPTHCDDIGGLWQVENKNKACSDSLVLTEMATNEYEMAYNVCGPSAAMVRIKGKGLFADRRYTVNWSSPPCGGTTVYEFDASCSKATGMVTKVRGLPFVCSALTSKKLVHLRRVNR